MNRLSKTTSKSYSDNSHPQQDGGLRVPFGLKGGRIFEPRQVPFGKRCGCICPGCGKGLIAKHALKNKVTAHFQHKPGDNCKNGRESAIHLAAKQLIEEHKKLFLPVLEVSIEKEDAMGEIHALSKILVKGGVSKLLSVRLEKSIAEIRPDLIAVDEDGVDLLIEIAVTSFVTDEKQDKIERQDIALIEIDASDVCSFEQLEKLLFEPSDLSKYEWKYHPNRALERRSLLEQLKPTLDAIEAQVKTAELEHGLSMKRGIERKNFFAHERQRRQETFKAMNLTQKLNFCLERLGIDESQIPPYLDQDIQWGDSFGVPHKLWQTFVFTAFIENGTGEKDFNVDDVFNWIGNRLVVGAEYLKYGRDVISKFLIYLSELGILRKYYGDHYQWTFSVEKGSLKKLLVEGVDMKKEGSRYIWEPLPSYNETNFKKSSYGDTESYAMVKGKRQY